MLDTLQEQQMRRVKAPPALAILATAALLGTTAQAANAAPTGTTTAAEASIPATVAPATDTPALVDELADPVDATIAPDRAAKAHLAGHKDRYKIADPAGTSAQRASTRRAGGRRSG
ncbi:hypothetical protein [Micromonospora sp. AMSO31t]|uniref:hypothetical protein n=1 Tax=Micromonospora sp. AMSO31t TaxID=2650566 RepID=UPI00124B5493|nr:hypothetical protein [Micromonospora sp. AMSO31t]KAB1915751.1 hypothetical protein F8274_02800 [Micromonospora sp. AMSO31t]